MVTYTFTNGTVADADEVNQNFTDVEGKKYADNVDNSTSLSTETDLSTITITQNDLNSNASLLIFATCKANGASGGATCSYSFKLYIGGALKKTINDIVDNDTTTHVYPVFNFLETGVDSTSGDIEVKITGSITNSGTAECNGLTVRGYND